MKENPFEGIGHYADIDIMGISADVMPKKYRIDTDNDEKNAKNSRNEDDRIEELWDEISDFPPVGPYGFDHLDSRHVERLMRISDKMIMLESKNVATLGLRGDALLHLHRYDEALECCTRALEIKPNWFPVLIDQGKALSRLDKNDVALKQFDEALDIAHGETHVAYWKVYEILLEKGVVFGKLGRHDEALKCFEEVRSEEVRTGHLDNEKKQWETYSRDVPFHKIARWYIRALCLSVVAFGKLGMLKEMIECYEEIVNLDSTTPEIPKLKEAIESLKQKIGQK